MTAAEFKAIVEDIEARMEGEGYFIHANLHSGLSFEGSWAQLIQNHSTQTIIVISKDDTPPFYVPLSAIESVQLSDR